MDVESRPDRSPRRLPTFFVPHGGGPCFFMDWPAPDADMWQPMAAFLRGLRDTLEVRPRAIVVISAHWEEHRPTVTSRIDPAPIYDYTGFPPHTYQLQYPAPGSPAVAARVRSLLGSSGITSQADEKRGFDHGVFVPFMLIEPEATIPIVTLSLVAGLDPETHLAMGRALRPLRDEGVLIVGSGMSYHSFKPGGPGSESFDAWLSATAVADAERRTERLRTWEGAPGARLAHPREEHLLPLMVAAGAAGPDLGSRVFAGRIFGAAVSGYRFG
jgi:aromatic ring-opening dioxygenase catalytic subunit (LigB family)